MCVEDSCRATGLTSPGRHVGTDDLIQPLDFACGLAAALLCRAREWCSANPARQALIRRRLEGAYQSRRRFPSASRPGSCRVVAANPRDSSAKAAALKRRWCRVRDFVSGKLAATIPPWAVLMNPSSERRARRQRGPGVFLSRWSAAWDFFSPLDSLSTRVERDR